jgi:DICT domain-containing protein
MTYTVTSFGKAFAHMRNRLLEKAHVINKNIDRFYTKTTQTPLSVKVNGVWTSEKGVENSSISRSTCLSKK